MDLSPKPEMGTISYGEYKCPQPDTSWDLTWKSSQTAPMVTYCSNAVATQSFSGDDLIK